MLTPHLDGMLAALSALSPLIPLAFLTPEGAVLWPRAQGRHRPMAEVTWPQLMATLEVAAASTTAATMASTTT